MAAGMQNTPSPRIGKIPDVLESVGDSVGASPTDLGTAGMQNTESAPPGMKQGRRRVGGLQVCR